jgi:hypothetical protein
MSVLEFYTADPSPDTLPEAPGFEDVRFELREKNPGVQELTKSVEDTDMRTLQASICVTRDNQAGFDLTTLETQPNGDPLMLSQECKYSQKEEVEKDLKQTVKDKHRLWQQGVQKWKKASVNGTCGERSILDCIFSAPPPPH